MDALTVDLGANARRGSNKSPQTPQTVGINSVLESFLNGTQAIVMVGLPGRGKTYIARRLQRYLSFFHGAPTKIFNLAEYRRRLYGKRDHTFFDMHDEGCDKRMMESARMAIKEMKEFLMEDTKLGHIAIFDGNNTTAERRAWILRELQQTHTKVMFIESIIENAKMVEGNIRKHQLSSPDYTETSKEEALIDFRKRIEHFTEVYETIDSKNEKLNYVKIFEGGEKVEIKGIHGYLPSRIVQFVMNVRFHSQSNFYLSRHGQSEYNRLGKIGGDSNLSEQGQEYAKAFADFCKDVVSRDEAGEVRRARLWTSSMKRTIETASLIEHPQLDPTWVNMMPRVWRGLDEIYAGVCDGMTYEEIRETFPREFEARKKNKLTYRYPRGESYVDLIDRLDPLVHEMERIKEPLVIVAHQAVLRLLYCYFKGDLSREEAPTISFPLHTVVQMRLDTYSCETKEYKLLPNEQLGDSEPPSH